MASPLITLKSMGLTFGGHPLFAGLDLYIATQDHLCLVGRNGSGKSTLLKIIAGLLDIDSGERLTRRASNISYLSQEPVMDPEKTIGQYVIEGLFDHPEGLGRTHERFQAVSLLEELGLREQAVLRSLSGGEKRKVALARVFLENPDLLLLDEPTNHLDLPTIEWLEEKLSHFRGAYVLISHDRFFLSRLSQATLWLDRGRIRRLDKGFASFEEWAETLLAQEESEMHKLNKRIAEETRWSHQGITARRRRNQGRLRRLQELRAHRASVAKQPGLIQNLEAASGDPSGRMIIEGRRICKSFEGKKIVENFSARVLRGDRIGIIGANGAGKTTLLKVLMGEIPPDSGKIRWGVHLRATYLDQNRTSLDPDRTLWETLCDTGSDQIMVRGQPRHVVGYLKDFLFEENQARTPVRVLSGGEKNRLILAKTFAKESNVMILDEPTNDLDMETLDLLQDVLDRYEGTVLLVSHDRSFLDRIATATWVFEGEGKVTEYAGGYSDYYRLRADGPVKRPQKMNAPSKQTIPLQSVPDVSVSPSRQKPVKRLSYHQQRLLDLLPQEIAQYEAEKKKIEESLSDPSLFTQDPQRFHQLSERHTQLVALIEEKETLWLTVTELKEGLEKE